MSFKSTERTMFVVIGATVLLLLIWAVLPKKDNQEFIDTKSIQIAE